MQIRSGKEGFFLVTSKKAFFYRFRFFYDASELWRKPKLQFFAPKVPQWVETNSYFLIPLCFHKISLENISQFYRKDTQQELWFQAKIININFGAKLVCFGSKIFQLA